MFDNTNQQLHSTSTSSIHCIITGVSSSSILSSDGVRSSTGLGRAIAVALGHPKYYDNPYDCSRNDDNIMNNINNNISTNDKQMIRINMVLVTRHHSHQNDDNSDKFDYSFLQDITNEIVQQWSDYYSSSSRLDTTITNITSTTGSRFYHDDNKNDDSKSSSDVEIIHNMTSTIEVSSRTDSTSKMIIILQITQMMIIDLGNIHTIDRIIDKIIYCWEQEVHDELSILEVQNETTRNSLEERCRQRQYIVIHNVGTLGHVGCLLMQSSLSSDTSLQPPPTTTVHDMNHTITLNITNPIHITNRIIHWFQTTTTTNQSYNNNMSSNVSLTIVNISSLCAIQAFPSMAMYSCVKAARDMYHSAIAKEVQEGDTDETTTKENSTKHIKCNVRCLNYAPGPLQNTNMTHMLLQKNSVDNIDSNTSELHTTIQKFYTHDNMKQNFVHPSDSAHVLMTLLLRKHCITSSSETTDTDGFMNGAHVDYYDCL